MTQTVKYPYIIMSESAANGYGGLKHTGVNSAGVAQRPNELSAVDQAHTMLDGRTLQGMIVYKAIFRVAPEPRPVTVTDIEIEEVNP